MAKIREIRPEIVSQIPVELADGVLYVCPSAYVAVHACCCGCGEEVVTPLVPTEWRLEMRRGRATLSPSVGNHDYPCRSHYIIADNKVIWAGAMSRGEIEAGREHDRILKRGHQQLQTKGIFGLPVLRNIAALWRRMLR